MTHPITFERIIKVILNHKKDWDHNDNEGTITYNEFENILMFLSVPPVTESRRVIKEKWKVLLDHRFLKKVNKSDTAIANIWKMNELINGPKELKSCYVSDDVTIEADGVL